MLTIRQQMEKDLAEANKQYQRLKPSEVFERQPTWMNDLFSKQPDPPRRHMSDLPYNTECEIISLRKADMTYGEIAEKLNIHSTKVVDVIQGFNE